MNILQQIILIRFFKIFYLLQSFKVHAKLLLGYVSVDVILEYKIYFLLQCWAVINNATFIFLCIPFLKTFNNILIWWYILPELDVSDLNPIVFISAVDDSGHVQKEQPDEKQGEFCHKHTHSTSNTT